jgi:polyphosphate glucokinase
MSEQMAQPTGGGPREWPEGTAFGVDIGGTGIKAAPVDIETGKLLTKRERIPTPHHSTPHAVSKVVAELVRRFDWHGPIGCAFPARIKRGVALTAANVDESWIGTDVDAVMTEATGCPATVMNDADAAGRAEMHWGAGRGYEGVVIMVTLGTGIGSALFVDEILVPNTELGHLVVRGEDAEARASANAREDHHMSWKAWAGHVDEYFHYLDALFSPDLFIIGGGVSEKADRFVPHLTVATEIVPAAMGNDAGIAGAALAVHRT